MQSEHTKPYPNQLLLATASDKEFAPQDTVTFEDAAPEVAPQEERVGDVDYTHIVECASELLGATLAFITSQSAGRTWSASSLEAPSPIILMQEDPRPIRHPAGEDMLIVEDLLAHPETSELDIAQTCSTYVGVVLRSKSSQVLGTFGVLFAEVTALSEPQKKLIHILARQAKTLLEQEHVTLLFQRQHEALAHLLARQEEALSTISHDTRNLLAGMLSNCEFALSQLEQRTGDVREALEDALAAAQQARHMVEHVEKVRASFKQHRIESGHHEVTIRQEAQAMSEAS